MLNFKTEREVIADQEARATERQLESDAVQAMSMVDNDRLTSTLAGIVRRDWQMAKSNKTTVEQTMLECLRERKGEYSPQMLAEIRDAGASEIYIKLATAKIRAGIAHIKSILLPSGEHAHGLKPTKNPDLPDWMRDQAVNYLLGNPNYQDEAGNPVGLEQQADNLEHMMKIQLMERAKLAAKRMERKIYDQMQEGDWSRQFSMLIDDFCTYPACFMKGPFPKMDTKLKWSMNAQGIHEPVRTMAPMIAFRTINPFDAYCAPGVDSVDRGFFIERLRLTRSEIFAMRGLDGYDNDAIDRVLSEDVGGRVGGQANSLNGWLWTDSSRQQIADHTTYFWYQSTSEVDGLHWYGKAQGWKLVEHGIPAADIEDMMQEYEVDVILINNEVIKCTLNVDPLYRRNIRSSCYEKIPGNVFGNSVSMLMRPTQRMVNGTARALQNNLAHASGFQVEIDHTRLSNETDPDDIYPFKIWQGRESEFSGDRPVVRFFQPDDNSGNLLGIMDKFIAMADNDTGIPEFFHGGSGGGEGADATARGRSMLMDQSAKLLRSSINNLDEDIVTPTLEFMYDYNMLYDPDQSLKGDAQVVARGPNAMLAREGSRQQHMALMEITANNPTFKQLAGLEGEAAIAKHLLDTYEEIDSDEIIPSGEALQNRIKEIQATPPPPDPKMLAVESNERLKMAELEAKGVAETAKQQMAREDRAAARILASMEMETKKIISQDDLDKRIADETVKLRAARAASYESAQFDIAKEKIKLEAAAAMKVAEMKMQLKIARESAKDKGDTDAAANLEFKPEDIVTAVESVVMPLFTQLQGETAGLVAEISNKLGEKEQSGNSGDINVTIAMPDCKPATRKVSTSRDAQGNLQATITPEGE